MLPKICPACGQKSLSFNQDYVTCTHCLIYSKRLHSWQRAWLWASQRTGWWWRLPILGWFGLMLVQNWRNSWFAIDRTGNPFSALDLGIHELGHVIFSPFGDFMHIAGGCLFQCIFPLLWLIGFLQKRWYFAAALCWCWLGLNLFDVAAYAADARARLLPLVTGLAGLYEQSSDEAYDKAHDWYQLLSRTHHLNADLAIGHGLRIAATISFFIGFVFGGILLARMVASTIQKTLHKNAKGAINGQEGKI